MTDGKTDDYADIIGLPHHEPKTHARMPISDRAAQFASFAALTGYGEAVEETARTVDGWQTRDEPRSDDTEFEVFYDLETEQA